MEKEMGALLAGNHDLLGRLSPRTYTHAAAGGRGATAMGGTPLDGQRPLFYEARSHK
jgi:hypothetical protein